jgi:hypothetical protein
MPSAVGRQVWRLRRFGDTVSTFLSDDPTGGSSTHDASLPRTDELVLTGSGPAVGKAQFDAGEIPRVRHTHVDVHLDVARISTLRCHARHVALVRRV